MVLRGPFSLDDPKDHSVDVIISDGGRPVQTSITKLAIMVSVDLSSTESEVATQHRPVLRLRVPAVMSVWCQAEADPVQSQPPDGRRERPCPDRHPTLHPDHTGYVAAVQISPWMSLILTGSWGRVQLLGFHPGGDNLRLGNLHPAHLQVPQQTCVVEQKHEDTCKKSGQ